MKRLSHISTGLSPMQRLLIGVLGIGSLTAGVLAIWEGKLFFSVNAQGQLVFVPFGLIVVGLAATIAATLPRH